MKSSEQVSDLGFQDGNPSQGGVEFTTQPGAFRALRAWSQSVRSHEEVVYAVAEQEKGLSHPVKQNQCRRGTERLPSFFPAACRNMKAYTDQK